MTYQADANFMWEHGIVHLYVAMALQLFTPGSLAEELAWLEAVLSFEVVS